MKDIILMGSTGSVGRNVLDVVSRHADKFRIKAISSNENISLLADQAREFSPEIVAIGNDQLYSDLKRSVESTVKVLSGPESLVQLSSEEPADIIFMAISGTAALNPLIAALETGRTVALASKEPVVSAGAVIKSTIEKYNSRILPVDSEHSAIMQCLSGRTKNDIERLYITGSGGSLKDRDEKEFDTLSIKEVLDHPKWDMGPKITVDSATLMNKGLEVIEAHWLFDVVPEKIKVIIHPEAIIHSMVEFIDGTISAALFPPDMRFPILRALSYPEVVASDLPRVDFGVMEKFSFSAPDIDKFPALKLAFEVLEEGGTLPAVLNGADETAVKLFLEGKIRITDIVKLIEKVIDNHKKIDDPTLNDIIEAERWANEEVLKFC